MIRGIQFKIPNKWGYMLKDILKNIDLADYDFEINDDNEIWMENNEQLFVEDIIDGEDFNKRISQNPYYIIFANIHIYKTGSKISKIKTYKEFLDSECEIIILIIDSMNVCIYAKDKEKLDKIELNVKKNEFENIEYITDENDNVTMKG